MSYQYELAMERAAELRRQADRERLLGSVRRGRRRGRRADAGTPAAAGPAAARDAGAPAVHLAA